MAVGVAGLAGELSIEGDIGAVEQTLAIARPGDHFGSAKIDPIHCFQAGNVDDGDGVVQPVGHVDQLSVG